VTRERRTPEILTAVAGSLTFLWAASMGSRVFLRGAGAGGALDLLIAVVAWSYIGVVPLLAAVAFVKGRGTAWVRKTNALILAVWLAFLVWSALFLF
jgi:hypothetical protein